MPPTRTAVVAGATGLVGEALVAELLDGSAARSTFDRVVTLGRRPTGKVHVRLDERTVDLLALGDATPDLVPTDLFCCLGTTIRKAGSQEAFRRVDHDMVLAFARWGREKGADRFFFVSTVGASPTAGAFYFRVKGETERDLRALGFTSFHAFRPGMLVGHRSEARPAEKIGVAAVRLLGPLFVGPLRKQHGMDVPLLARAMVGAAVRDEPGVHVSEYDAIVALAKHP
jgi:uncharacterized protein YbjT (DUF2867 family)